MRRLLQLPRIGLRSAAAAALLLFCYGYFVHYGPRFRAANESIRFYFVEAVAERGAPHVDPELMRHGVGNLDRAVIGGRSTLDKSPGLSYAVLPLYLAFTRLAGISVDPDRIHLLCYLLTLFGVGLPAVAGVFALRAVVLRLTGDAWAACGAALTVGLATPYALYATLFFGHLPATVLLTCGFLCLLQRRSALAGAAAGAMVLTDGATFLLAAGLGLAAAARSGRGARGRLLDLLAFGAAALPFVAAHLLHNYWLFGDPLSFGYHHKGNSDFAALHGQGLLGFSLPSATALWEITVGAKRGLLYSAPVLLASIPGLVLLARDPRRRWAGLTIGGLCLGHLLLMGGFSDWSAGDSYAARHLTPLIPLLGVGLGRVMALAGPTAGEPGRGGDQRRLATFVLLKSWLLPGLLALSLAGAWLPSATFPYAPQGFENPLLELALPLFLVGHGVQSAASGAGLGGAAGMALVLLPMAAATALLLPGPGLLRAAAALAAPILRGVLVGTVLLGLAVATPLRPGPRALQDRVLVECLLGYVQTATKICQSAHGRIRAGCRCVKPSK